MALQFSDTTAKLLKALPFYNELFSDETNTNLSCIKQLTGCRAILVQNCLEIIKKLDDITDLKGDKKKNNLEKIKVLIQMLNEYKSSCERYLRCKDNHSR